MNVTRAWERFWFADIPPTSYAVLRIVFGLVGLFNLLSYTPVSAYWPIESIAPLPGGGVGLRGWLQESGLGTLAGYAYFVTLLCGFIALTAGFKTRLAVLTCFVGTIGQKWWNHLPLTSSVDVIAMVLFSLLFVDAGAVLSVDAVRRRSDAPSIVDAAPIWPLRLVRTHVAFLYLNAGLWKLFGSAWREGTALHYALSHNIFHRFPTPAPPEAGWLLIAGTYLTLFWETAFPLLILSRYTRTAALLIGIGVHLGIWLTMEVGSFSVVTLATYVAFLDPHRLPARLVSLRARFHRQAPVSSSSTAAQ